MSGAISNVASHWRSLAIPPPFFQNPPYEADAAPARKAGKHYEGSAGWPGMGRSSAATGVSDKATSRAPTNVSAISRLMRFRARVSDFL